MTKIEPTAEDLAAAGREPTDEEIRHRWDEARESLMYRAMEASKRAMSWRNFNVGCAVLAYRANAKPEDRWAVFVGANVKVTQDARPVCAEMTAILAALHAGFDRIVGLAVFGEPQEDHASGIKPKHLHPCGSCRQTMEKLPLIRPDTRILSVKVSEWQLSEKEAKIFEDQSGLHKSDAYDISTEEMTFAELLLAHANGNGNH